MLDVFDVFDAFDVFDVFDVFEEADRNHDDGMMIPGAALGIFPTPLASPAQHTYTHTHNCVLLHPTRNLYDALDVLDVVDALDE